MCVLLAVALAAGGCGGGVDSDDPEDVARALADAIYRCNEDDVALIQETTLPAEQAEVADLDPAEDNCDVSGSELTGLDDRDSAPRDDPPDWQTTVISATTVDGQPIRGDDDYTVVRVVEIGSVGSDDGSTGDVILARTDEGWRWSPDTRLLK
jgi:hypothetical protein